MNLENTHSVISSPESEDGPSQLALLDGPTIENCGPAPARASRSARPAKASATTTNGTCGPTSFACSVPDGPLSGWESRLRQRLARIGSTECLLTWKASTTPAGRPLSRLVPSMRPIAATVSGSSPSEAALWITCSARDWKDTPGMGTSRPDGRSRIDQLPRQVAAACWPTPTRADGQQANDPGRWLERQQEKAAQGINLHMHLPVCVSLSTWPTPTASADKSIRTPEGARTEVDRGKSPDLAAHVMAMWPTPVVTDSIGARNATSTRNNPDSKHHAGTTLTDAAWLHDGVVAPGQAHRGSLDTAEKPGALAPGFVSWLMGFPPEWLDCAPDAMPKKPRKSK